MAHMIITHMDIAYILMTYVVMVCIVMAYTTIAIGTYWYREMEMFVDIKDALVAVEDYLHWMETDAVKLRHSDENYVSVMVRYVAADEILLSPMYGRDTAVISVIVGGVFRDVHRHVHGCVDGKDMISSHLL